MTVISNPLLLKKKATAGGGSAYQIEKSVRLNRDDEAYFSRTPAIKGNRRTWTWSGWVKRVDFGDGASKQSFIWSSIPDLNPYFQAYFYNNKLSVDIDGAGVEPTRLFRDPSAWMHIVIAVDTTQATATERLKLYINGHLETDFGSDTRSNIGLNEETNINSTDIHTIGSQQPYSSVDTHVYLSDVQLIDGLQLSAAAFGSFDSNTGVWNPKAFALPAPNTGTTWSSSLTNDQNNGFNNSTSAANLFDGDLTTYISGNGNFTFTPPGTGIEYTTSVEVYFDYGSDSSHYEQAQVNSLGWVDLEHQKWKTIHLGSGTLTTLKFRDSRGTGLDTSWMRAIRIDGVILVDGQTDPTTRTNPNNGTQWRTYADTISNWDTSTHVIDELFDGIIDSGTTANGAASNGASTAALYDLGSSKKITGIERVRIRWLGSAADDWIKVNGGSAVNPTTAGTWQWSSFSVTEFQSLQTKNWGTYVGAIEIDGTVLVDVSVDNSFHLKFNDTSLNRYLGKDTLNGKIADATGGLPIYKTSDDYGDVKGSGYREDNKPGGSGGNAAGTTDGTGLILAIPGDGAIADVHHSINTGSTVKSLTATSVTASDTSASRFYGSSFALDAQTDGIEVTSGNSDFAFGTGDFTIEMWVNHTGGFTLYDDRPTGTNGNYVMLGLSNTSFTFKQDDTDRITATIPGANTGWKHLAAVRNSGTTKLYCNGVEKGSWSDSTNYISGGSNRPRIGHNGYANPGNYATTGSYQDVRVYKGVAKYTSNFTVPNRNDFTVNNLTASDGIVTVANADAKTKPIYVTSGDQGGTKGSGYNTDAYKSLLVFAVPGDTIADVSHVSDLRNSGSAVSITNRNSVDLLTTQSRFYGTSMYFDGNTETNDSTGDAIHIDTSNVTLGTGEFTVEFWIRCDSLFNNFVIFDCRHGTENWPNNDDGWSLNANSAGTIWSDGWTSGGGAGGSLASATGVLKATTWQHIAATRDSSNVFRIFVDGTQVSSRSSVTQDFNETRMCWGNSASFGEGFKGFIQDIRVYKGSGACKYTSNFEVPNFGDAPGVDSLTDTPTNYGTDAQAGGEVRGNYCTLNPLDLGSNIALSQGNLTATISGNSTVARGTIGVQNSGKWYFEVECKSDGADNNKQIGVHPLDIVKESYVGADKSVGYHKDGRTLYAGDQTGSTGSTWGAGDTIGVALDLSGGGTNNGKVTFYKNGTAQSSGIVTTLDCTKAYTVAIARSSGGSGSTVFNVNTGQRAFKYTAPAGHKCICTQNLADTFSGEAAGTVNNPSKVFDVVKYTGTSASQDIKGIGFQPDLVWIKSRDATYDHAAFDAVRGANKRLRFNTTAVEGTDTQTLTAFNSDGFTTGTDDVTNKDGDEYVAWNWDAGTTSWSSSDSDVTAGTTASTGWTNKTAGFSIVQYEGNNSNTTVGHNLGAAPKFIIIKNIDAAKSWVVGHDSLGWDTHLWLNGTDATGATYDEYRFNSTAPTSTVFSIGSTSYTNADNETHIAYCWTPIPGFSAFGKYSANADSNGPLVNCGFKPRWIMIKASSSAGDMSYASWLIVDSERDTYNVSDAGLFANKNAAEGTRGTGSDSAGTWLDILSNGFKIRYAGTEVNGSNGQTYIYAAFAEHPQKLSRAH